MSLVEISWNPERRQLRNFGISALAASAVISLLLYALKGLGIQWAFIIFGVGFAIFLSSLISAKLTRIIYLGLMLVTLPVGWMVSFVLLAVCYFVLLMPLGLVFRLVGRDALCRKFDRAAKSYWLAHRPPDRLERYFHQF